MGTCLDICYEVYLVNLHNTLYEGIRDDESKAEFQKRKLEALKRDIRNDCVREIDENEEVIPKWRSYLDDGFVRDEQIEKALPMIVRIMNREIKEQKEVYGEESE